MLENKVDYNENQYLCVCTYVYEQKNHGTIGNIIINNAKTYLYVVRN